MTTVRLLGLFMGALLLLGLEPAAARAQLAITYVSEYGSDAKNCSVPQEACRFLQRAHDLLRPGGTIYLLDSGWFGSLTITKSISVRATGVDAAVARLDGTAITIDAGAEDSIYLDGLQPLGIDFSPNGVRVISAGNLHLRNCYIRGFTGAGLHVETSSRTRVTVSDCVIRDNGGDGILAKAVGAGKVSLTLRGSVVESNGRDGLRAAGAGTLARVGGSTIAGNASRAARAGGGAQILSFGDNLLVDNGADGAFTGSAALE